MIKCLLLISVTLILFYLLLFWTWETEGVVNSVTYRWTGQCVIVFDDQRNLTLRGQPNKSILAGKNYKITYNNFKYFTKVEEIEK